MNWKPADPLLKVLKEAVARVPQLKFAYGAVGVAAAGGLMTLILGQNKAAIIIWGLAFCATILVTVFAQSVTRHGRHSLAGKILINCVIVVFCGFLLLTITAFLNLGPAAWANFLGIDEGKVQAFQQTGNGPVNFGCEAGNAATAQVTAPDGMHIRNVTIEPVDVHAAKTVTPHISNDGKTATGKIDYFGQDRDWTRNCQGGGHGAAMLKGEFERDATSLWALISVLLALSVIIGLITLFGSGRPPRQGQAALRI
jgi:hypothetical protein